jgi:hypothetical protein
MGGRLHRGVGDTLFWLAAMLGVLWLLIWIDDVAYLRWVSVVAGVGMVLFTLPRFWPALVGRGDASPLVARIGMGLLLLVGFAAAVSAAVVGWRHGLVNRPPDEEQGLDFLVPGMAVATACLGFGRHYFPPQPSRADT